MKKKMRMITCLLLVVLMVASLSSPAFASEATDSGTGKWNDYPYNWSYTVEKTSSTAGLSLPTRPASVTVKIENTIYNSDNDISGPARNEGTGYASISVTANNRFEEETSAGIRYYRGIVTAVKVDYIIASTRVYRVELRL